MPEKVTSVRDDCEKKLVFATIRLLNWLLISPHSYPYVEESSIESQLGKRTYSIDYPSKIEPVGPYFKQKRTKKKV